ncbi:hypothetical protein GCM10022251_33540 [Phytohabitans flavus]|uniref:DUF676 domain-containing protein n=1 Tax=Phytohabitans flavus TaxID=1076124 RepID=A0A6F8XNG3_9ACTN|nr:hypothetical protein [Phytohabitans flavus]BCB75291.1 hypothetical protein Pflav_017010 [Phytohabitans flavus]
MFAWDIFYRFSSHNVAVDVVAHSMGGLVANAAITGVQRGDPAFPPYLYVDDVVAIATPWNGVTVPGACQHSTVQCAEMRGDAPTLNWLNENAQASSGTDWTLVGIEDDGVVHSSSAIARNRPSYGHKLVYHWNQFGWNPVDVHSNFRFDNGRKTYMYCDYYRSCDMNGELSTFTQDGVGNPIERARMAVAFHGLY